MRQDAIATRARLVATAERLFAERSIDAVSMNEIQRAAEQKNKSALQYHFGTKDQLVAAILEKHAPGVDLRRESMLDAIEARDPADVRALVAALVFPVAEKLDDRDGGRDYLIVASQLVGRPTAPLVRPSVVGSSRGVDRLVRLLTRACPEIPEQLRMSRWVLVTGMLFHGLADFARLSSSESPTIPASARELYVNNLVDAIAAIITTNASSPTLASLAPHGG